MQKIYINYVYDIHNDMVTKFLHTNMNTKPCIHARGRWNSVPGTWNGRILNSEYVRAG